MMADDLVTHFSAIDDPRCAGKVEHHLMDVLVIAVCATIAGSESWEDMALYGRSKEAWLPASCLWRAAFPLMIRSGASSC